MKGPDAVEWSELSPLSAEATANLEEYNGPFKPAELAATANGWRAKIEASDGNPLDITPIADWIAPHYARAELQANRAEWRFQKLEVALFALSLLAVSTAAGQSLLQPRLRKLVWIEVACLLLVGAGVLVARYSRLHDRWISARYLGRGLSVGDVPGRGRNRRSVRGPESRDAADDDPEEAWLSRAFAEVWDGRPIRRPTEADVGPLQRLLAAEWIGDQAEYHERAAKRHARRKQQFRVAATVLFVVSLGVAVAHIFLKPSGEHEWWGFASIVIPATAAAASGLAAQREYHLHFQRYRRMARRLAILRTQMDEAPDLSTVQSIALETERVVRDENGQWFGVVRLHDLELPG